MIMLKFAGNYLIVIEADAMTQVTAESFQQIPFWVQVSGIPLGHLVKPYGEMLGKEIANSMGEFMEFDPYYRSKFMRIRVGLDSKKPLLRGKLLSLDKRKDNIWISFQYERLSKFCYFCGHLDHIQKDCAALMEAIENGSSTIPQYNNSLKTAGLSYVNFPDSNNVQRYDKKSIAQIALEASIKRSTVAPVDPIAKRLKIDNTSTSLKIANGKPDDKVGVMANNYKPKEVAEGAKNNVTAPSKIGHKGVNAVSPNLQPAGGRRQNETFDK